MWSWLAGLDLFVVENQPDLSSGGLAPVSQSETKDKSQLKADNHNTKG